MSWPVWTPPVVAANTTATATALLGLSGYTPEQWATAQQSWQQWAQWQEQYTQWQLQYGDKYAEQVLNAQATAQQAGTTQPPLPPSEARPPPPPDAPPPQPKAEEDKTATYALYQQYADLQTNKKGANATQTSYYGSATSTATQSSYPHIAPLMSLKTSMPDMSLINASKGANYSETPKRKYTTDNNYKYTESTEIVEEPPKSDFGFNKNSYNTTDWYSQLQAASSSYALQNQAMNYQNNVLSEEERQFDVQFKKWEEEFEAWKRQNINHPDKVAYQEYEKKFQACRQQLIERKEQMRAKRMAAMMTQKPADSKTPTTAQYFDPAAVQKAYTALDNKNGDGYSTTETVNFLPKMLGAGIPGLDLAEERVKTNEVVDITESDPIVKPDFKAISKGINNILGDQKLLNMLSLVTQSKNLPQTQNQYEDECEMPAKRPRWEESVSGENSAAKYNDYSNHSSNASAGYNTGSMMDYDQSYDANQMGGPSDYDNSHQGDRYDNSYQGDRYDNSSQNNSYYQEPMSHFRRGYDQEKRDRYYDDGRDSHYGGQRRQPRPYQPQWTDFPLLEPVTIIDYQHQSLTPGIEFLEPVQTFDYNHMPSSKNIKDDNDQSWMDVDDNQRNYGMKNNRMTSDNGNDSSRNMRFNASGSRRSFTKDRKDFVKGRDFSGDFNRRDDRNQPRFDDRNKYKDKNRDRRDRYERRSNSKDRSKKPEDVAPAPKPDAETNDIPISNQISNVKNVVMIDDILESPGREVRPEKIVIILRGLPGSGKSYLAKLIKDKEVENGGSAPRILSMDDYFMSESEVTVEDAETGRKTKKREMKYEYDKTMEEMYINSLLKSYKRTLSDGFFPFIIVDSVNDQDRHFFELETSGRQLGFKVYICEMDVDAATCHKRNVHDRTAEDIETISAGWCPTPARYTLLDATTLLQAAAIDHVQMEDVSDEEIEDQQKDNVQNEEEEVLAPFTSKWDRMDDTDKLAKLDGTSKPLRHAPKTMEDFLQLDDWAIAKTAKPGKKTVRWADIEERRQQEKMRAIGFVVGQTDWQRMTDPTQGSSALTQTKYIERIGKY